MTLLFDLLNRSSQTLLDLDPDSREMFGQLQGKVICIDVTFPAMTLYLMPGESGLEFHEEYEGDADVTLRGSAFAFAKLSGQGVASGVLSEGQIHMQGDAETGQAFQKIMSRLDLDWEELLSNYVGDTPARKIGNVVREFSGWAKQSADHSRENVADYFQEEKKLLVTSVAMKRFTEQVDTLRADVDRLQQRLNSLADKLQKASQ